MTRGHWFLGLSVALMASACGGSVKEAEEPSNEPETLGHARADSKSDIEQNNASTGEEEAATKKPESEPVKQPEFKEGMSVSDAMNAVPAGTTRVNIDQETLGQPLNKPELYAPCKLGANQHFKVTVAVWNGKAVGVDIETKPANKNAEACVDKQIRSITWQDKVPSLNTVEYSF